MRKLLLLMLVLGFTSLRAADVQVTVEGVDEIRGQLLIGIFTNEEDFQKNPIEQSPTVQVEALGPVVSPVIDLEPGVYAVAVIWDWNLNGVLDKMRVIGKPVEPYGFSNNPRGFGNPKFTECTFTVTEEGGMLTVSLIK